MHSQNGASFLPLFVLFFSCFRQKRGFFSSPPYDKRLRFPLLIFLTRFLTWHFWHFPPSFSFHVKTLDVFGRWQTTSPHTWLQISATESATATQLTAWRAWTWTPTFHQLWHENRVWNNSLLLFSPSRCACGKSSPDCYSSHRVQKCPSITVSLSLDRPLWLWPFTQAQNPLKVALGGRRRRREAFCCCWMQI